MNNLNQSTSGIKEFLDRSFEKVEGGYWDGKGFYCTPEGSFWDENGVYFNREGIDRHGGFYDEFTIYNPGAGWVEEFGCYQDEMNPEVDDDIKEVIANNFNEDLNYEFLRNEKYYKDDDEDLDEDFDNDRVASIFGQYIENNLSNFPAKSNQSCDIVNQNDGDYDKLNLNSNIHKIALESSAGKTNIGSSNSKSNRFNESIKKYEY